MLKYMLTSKTDSVLLTCLNFTFISYMNFIDLSSLIVHGNE